MDADFLQQLVANSNGTLTLGGSRGLYDDFMGFVHAIRWTEPWIVGLIVVHVVVALSTVMTRRSPNTQLAIFFNICAAVYMAERINSYAATNWRMLGFTQNYFDKRGVFVSLMYSAPLLIIGMGQMLYALILASDLLVKAKRKELISKERARNREAAAAGDAVGDQLSTDAQAGVPASTAAPADAQPAKSAARQRKR